MEEPEGRLFRRVLGAEPQSENKSLKVHPNNSQVFVKVQTLKAPLLCWENCIGEGARDDTSGWAAPVPPKNVMHASPGSGEACRAISDEAEPMGPKTNQT